MIGKCSYVLFIGIPTPQNIDTIKIFTDVPNSPTKLSEPIVRRALKDQTLVQYAQEVLQVEIIHEVYGVAPDALLPRWSLIVCLEHSPQAEIPRVISQDDDEANDVVGKMERDFKRYTKAVRSGKSPSAAAKSNNYSENQASDNALLDGRFNESGNTTTALPIELYHPAFANFLSNARDPDLQVPDDVLCSTAKLIRQLSVIRVLENPRSSDCRQTLADIMGSALSELVNKDSSSADFMSPHPTPMNVFAAPDIVEIKSEWGSGGCDPSVQVSFSYARFYCQDDSERIRDVSCCPSFLVGLAGSWIGILGAVMTSRTIVQRLSGFEWFGCSRALDNEQVINLGRLLYALRLGIAELKQYYSNLAAPTVIPGHVAPRFCPYIDSVVDSTGQTVTFSYVQPLEPEPTCATFQAKLLDGEDAGKLVVVKFVKQYCAAAHTWLAGKGFAPRLVYDGTSGPRYGGFALVVMDYVEGKTLHALYDKEALPNDVRKAVRKALNELAKGKFIFGDLRTPNIMLTNGDESVEKRLHFIDFDWACREGDGVRYPFHLSRAIWEPSGASEYQFIERKHQESMFNSLNWLK
uniref:Protein kinase domain-containing protein n=1 Tax=Moniliophthora roreri TaxID=221103 RepID=A0A0W0G6G0_MONRR